MELPFVDEFCIDVRAPPGPVFLEVAGQIARGFEGLLPRILSALLRCENRGNSYSVPPALGQEANGFRVARVEAPSVLVLEGQHQFAIYRLSFFVDALSDETSRVRARTDAAFPGFKGAAYRAMVIGSGGHRFIVRRLLAAIARRAERDREGQGPDPMTAPPYELRPTARFADRASDYALFRPSYPKEAIDAALHGLTLDAGSLVVDVGAGTGIASRLFADRGLNVLAVEPNQAMRESAEPHPRVRFQDGAAEATGCPASIADLVVVAQAFHWFRPEEALAEFRRLLKPGGRLVFLVNERDDQDPAMLAYNTAIRASAERELSEGLREAVESAVRGLGVAAPPVAIPYSQTLTRDGLIGRARSASYVPQEGPRYERLLEDLDALWRTHQDTMGKVSLAYRTIVWRVEASALSALGPADQSPGRG